MGNRHHGYGAAIQTNLSMAAILSAAAYILTGLGTHAVSRSSQLAGGDTNYSWRKSAWTPKRLPRARTMSVSSDPDGRKNALDSGVVTMPTRR